MIMNDDADEEEEKGGGRMGRRMMGILPRSSFD